MRRFRYIPIGMGWGLRYDRRRGVVDEVDGGPSEREYGTLIGVEENRFRGRERN